MVLAAFFIGLGGWAAIAPLNGAVVAPGVIKVEGNRKTIQHLDGGIVKELRIKEGDRVEIGQTVIVLEETQARAAVDVMTASRRPACTGGAVIGRARRCRRDRLSRGAHGTS
jgi:epimerase transport system membrane fusion protein